MYVVACVIGSLFLLLFILSLKRGAPTERKGIWKILDKMSFFIMSVFGNIQKFVNKHTKNQKYINCSSDINSYLEQLQPGSEIAKLRETYVVQKLSLSILIVILGTLVGVIVRYTTYKDSTGIDLNGGIQRNVFSGEKKEMEVEAVVDGYESVISFQLHPQKLSDEEIEEIIPEFHGALGEVLKAGNSSLDCVSESINPVIKLDGYPFSIRWNSSDYGLVSPNSGAVTEVEQECQVFMTAYIKYEEKTWEEMYVLTLVPIEYSREEGISIGLEREVLRTEEAMREDEIMQLPQEYEGKTITWTSVVKDYSAYIWGAAVLVAVVIFFMSDKDLEKKVNEKKTRMKREYSEIVRKLALYVGAGMTVRASFRKIAIDAIERGEKNPIYMEMMFTCRELKSGISEEEAYERFGRRTGVQKYIQMSTLLQQNIKRGSANLLGRLREEAENAAIERLQACRKRGEEASTKLLVPMVLILLVVMVVIMMPAFSSMNL